MTLQERLRSRGWEVDCVEAANRLDELEKILRNIQWHTGAFTAEKSKVTAAMQRLIVAVTECCHAALAQPAKEVK